MHTCKRGGYEDGGKASYASNKGRPWNIPVLSSDVLVHDVAATVDRNAQNDKNYNCDDLEQAEPVFEFAIGLDGYDIDANYDNPEYQTYGVAGEVGIPILDHELYSRLGSTRRLDAEYPKDMEEILPDPTLRKQHH